MAKDGINWDPKPGRPANDKESPWRIAYGWLWEQKFPYWQMDWFWQDLIQKAASPYRWLRFTTEDKNPTKGMVGPTSKKHEIVIDVPYYMHVELDCNQQHLLLLNRGIDNNDEVTNYCYLLPTLSTIG
ncbi:MAG: hypothetical protein F6J98_39825 [Moorea sp. SIO4G2]|nr:hypothetical protein [Moorena sp. SIO4G2]